jgi:oxygen-dependent protoporphyrinogen oxidase
VEGSYEVVVVGAGISGLACAHELHRCGTSVLVLERSDTVGGVIQTRRSERGALIELGPQTLRSNDSRLFSHLTELGLEVVEAGAAGSRRFLCHEGRLEPLPHSPLAALRTPLLSRRGKLRALLEPVRRGGRASDQSVHDFFSSRFGVEVAERLVDPFVSGILAGDPRQLSVRSAFPAMWNAVRESGSLSRHVFRTRTGGGGTPKPKARLFSFRNGMGAWPAALRARLGKDRIRTGYAVRTLRRSDDGWTVAGTRADGHSFEFNAGAVVVAVPATAAASLVESIAPGEARALRDITYASVATVHLAYRREAVGHALDGFGMLVPRREGRPILGTLWISSLFTGRCPTDQVLTTTFIGGARDPQRVGETDATLVALAHSEHEALVGAREAPQLARVHRWSAAIPQYDFGHGQRVAAVDALQERYPNLRLIGSYAGGVAVPACWSSGVAAARALLDGRSRSMPDGTSPPRRATAPTT